MNFEIMAPHSYCSMSTSLHQDRENLVKEVFDELMDQVATETAAKLHRLIQTGELTFAGTDDKMHRRSLYPTVYETDEALEEDLKRFAVERPKRKHEEMMLSGEAQQPDTSSKDTDSADTADTTSNAAAGHDQPSIEPQSETKQESKVADSAPSVELSTTSSGKQPPPTTSSVTAPTVASGGAGVAILPPNASLNAAAAAAAAVQPPPPPRSVMMMRDIWGRHPAKEPAELVTCSVCAGQVNGLRFASHLDKCLGIGTMSRNAAAGASRKS